MSPRGGPVIWLRGGHRTTPRAGPSSRALVDCRSQRPAGRRNHPARRGTTMPRHGPMTLAGNASSRTCSASRNSRPLAGRRSRRPLSVGRSDRPNPVARSRGLGPGRKRTRRSGPVMPVGIGLSSVPRLSRRRLRQAARKRRARISRRDQADRKIRPPRRARGGRRPRNVPHRLGMACPSRRPAPARSRRAVPRRLRPPVRGRSPSARNSQRLRIGRSHHAESQTIWSRRRIFSPMRWHR